VTLCMWLYPRLSYPCSSNSMLPTPSSHVFLHHDPEDPPPPPGPEYTRFVCISDTHSRIFRVPPGDVLLHAGDLSSWGKVSELKKTIYWLASLPHPVKIIIAGNHDLCLDPRWAEAFHGDSVEEALQLVRGPSAQKAGIQYLEHESVEFIVRGRRWKAYGSPAAPRYADGAFQFEPGPEGREIYARIPVDTHILLTHTPPYETHDLTKRGKHAGCKDLSERLWELEVGLHNKSDIHWKSSASAVDVKPADRPRPEKKTPWNCRLHVWGHIHEAYGASIEDRPNGDYVQVNAALAGHGEPVIVDLHNGHHEGRASSDLSG